MSKFLLYQKVRIVDATSRYYQRVGTVHQIFSYGYAVMFHRWLMIAPVNRKGQVKPVFFREGDIELR